MIPDAGKRSQDELLSFFCAASRELMKEMKPLADCTVFTCDGVEFRLHKATLTQESKVLGCGRFSLP